MAEDGFDCASCTEGSGAEAAECIVQDLEHRVIPTGTRKLAGQERQYRTTLQKWLTREEFIVWSKKQGLQVDPICWFTEMGHGPIPADVTEPH
jgi:hypothetical protein